MAIYNPDDLKKGDFITVHSVKDSNEHMPLMGHAFEIKAVERPFVALEHFATKQKLHLDERYFNFMKIGKDYAESQVDDRPQPRKPIMSLFPNE